MNEATRIVFMGTPDFALPTLRALIGRYTVVAVVTQPDRPAGRGRSMRCPPVKNTALAHGISVLQPKNLGKPENVARLREWAPDVIVTAATGHILTPQVLAIPKHGTLNVHASLLPRWRGAAPIQAAIMAGDAETGVTIMCTDEGLDTGPILSQRAVPIAARETTASMHDKLSDMGADLLLETLPSWLSGHLTPHPQPSAGVTMAKRINKNDGLIDWDLPAPAIDRQVRAYTPWPGAFTFWAKRRLKVSVTYPLPYLESTSLDSESTPPGTVVQFDDYPAVRTGEGLLRLDQLQLAGKQVLSGTEFVRGRPDFAGARLGTD